MKQVNIPDIDKRVVNVGGGRERLAAQNAIVCCVINLRDMRDAMSPLHRVIFEENSHA
jgi:hypothetical protein